MTDVANGPSVQLLQEIACPGKHCLFFISLGIPGSTFPLLCQEGLFSLRPFHTRCSAVSVAPSNINIIIGKDPRGFVPFSCLKEPLKFLKAS